MHFAERFDKLIEGFQRGDGWKNIITGLGKSDRDPTLQSTFQRNFLLDVRELDNLYSHSALAARISDLPAFYSTKEGITVDVEPETQQQITAWMESVGAMKTIANLVRWSQHYGGAIAVLGLDDGLDPELPLNENTIKSLDHTTVVDRWDVPQLDVERDRQSPEFGQITHYHIHNPMSGNRSRIHASRVLRVDGVKVSGRQLLESQGWGWSIMERVRDAVRSYGESMSYVEHIIRDFTQDVYQINNLSQLLEKDKGEQIRERMRIIRLSKSILNAVIIGKEENYEKRSTTVAGLDKILTELQFQLSAETGIPVSLLFGRSAAGMNATGENDIRNYYDFIGGYQESNLRDPVRRFIELSGLVKDSGVKALPPAWSYKFNPLWKMSDKELADIDKLNSDAEANRVNAGILQPEEIALSKYDSPESPIQLIEGLRNIPDIVGAFRSGEGEDE